MTRIRPGAAFLLATSLLAPSLLAGCAGPSLPPLMPLIAPGQPLAAGIPGAPGAPIPAPGVPAPEATALATGADVAALSAQLPGSDVARRDAPGGTAVSIVSIPDSVLFDFGVATPRADAGAALDAMAAAIARAPAGTVVTVAGDTDAVGSADFNQALSEERARAVVAALAERGIDPARLAAIGFGRTRPVASNATPEGRARNRRAELALSGSFAANEAALDGMVPVEASVPNAALPQEAAAPPSLARHPARLAIHANRPEAVTPHGLGPAISY